MQHVTLSVHITHSATRQKLLPMESGNWSIYVHIVSIILAAVHDLGEVGLSFRT